MSSLQRPSDWEQPVRLPDDPRPTCLLVPFDGSHASERALAWASRLAGADGAEIVVMVAYEAPLTKRGRGATYVDSLREELRQEALELAGEAVALLVARGHRARAIVVRGEPAAAVEETAESEGCDLVVMGRSGLSAEIAGDGRSVGRLVNRVIGRGDYCVMVVD